MYLIDTNIFLEVLLSQERREICKRFLDENGGDLFVSDFSLHSIGVILFRNNREDVFQKFVHDAIPNINIITLSKESYEDLAKIRSEKGLDFDDAYQYKIAQENELKIATMDKDFERIKGEGNITFLQDIG